jgi:hypothetical protein
MNQVKVKKDELLKILRKNRAEHRDIFLKAQEKYREVAIKELDAQLKAARSGKPFVLAKIVRLVQPQDYTAQYDRAIQMLEMSVDDTIIITASEFANFVQDIWNWSRDWAVSNSSYVKSAKLAALSAED